MDSKLFGQAICKFLAGLVLVGVLLFLPAGTLAWPQGWLLIGILFVPMFAAGLVCAGLAIFLFYGCKAVTKGCAWLTKMILLATKRCFIKKEDK